MSDIIVITKILIADCHYGSNGTFNRNEVFRKLTEAVDDDTRRFLTDLYKYADISSSVVTQQAGSETTAIQTVKQRGLSSGKTENSQDYDSNNEDGGVNPRIQSNVYIFSAVDTGNNPFVPVHYTQSNKGDGSKEHLAVAKSAEIIYSKVDFQPVIYGADSLDIRLCFNSKELNFNFSNARSFTKAQSL